MRKTLRFLAGTARFAPLALLLSVSGNPAHGSESWHVSSGVGVLLFQGGQPTRDSVAGTLRLGYDLDAPVSLELGGLVGGGDSRSSAVDGGNRNLYGSWADAIIHLARWERLDPYLNVGVGALWSDNRAWPDNRQECVVPRLGAGFLYSVSEHWSVRAGVTLMTLRLNDRHDCFGLAEAGLCYYFGDTTPARPGQAE